MLGDLCYKGKNNGEILSHFFYTFIVNKSVNLTWYEKQQKKIP